MQSSAVFARAKHNCYCRRYAGYSRNEAPRGEVGHRLSARCCPKRLNWYYRMYAANFVRSPWAREGESSVWRCKACSCGCQEICGRREGCVEDRGCKRRAHSRNKGGDAVSLACIWRPASVAPVGGCSASCGTTETHNANVDEVKVQEYLRVGIWSSEDFFRLKIWICFCNGQSTCCSMFGVVFFVPRGVCRTRERGSFLRSHWRPPLQRTTVPTCGTGHARCQRTVQNGLQEVLFFFIAELY